MVIETAVTDITYRIIKNDRRVGINEYRYI